MVSQSGWVTNVRCDGNEIAPNHFNAVNFVVQALDWTCPHVNRVECWRSWRHRRVCIATLRWNPHNDRCTSHFYWTRGYVSNSSIVESSDNWDFVAKHAWYYESTHGLQNVRVLRIFRFFVCAVDGELLCRSVCDGLAMGEPVRGAWRVCLVGSEHSSVNVCSSMFDQLYSINPLDISDRSLLLSQTVASYMFARDCFYDLQGACYSWQGRHLGGWRGLRTSQGFLIPIFPVNCTMIKRETVLLLKEQYVSVGLVGLNWRLFFTATCSFIKPKTGCVTFHVCLHCLFTICKYEILAKSIVFPDSPTEMLFASIS